MWAAAPQPVNVPASLTQDPVLTGNPVDGNTLGVTNVSTAGFQTPTIEYLWYRCTSRLASPIVAAATAPPTGCVAMTGTGVTSDTYALQYADAGKFISARVGVKNAANAVGEFRWTASTEVAVTSPAKNTVRPALTVGSPSTSGKPKVGGTVATTGGTWTGFPSTTLAYQWYSCDTQQLGTFSDVPAGCSKITTGPSATQATYSVGADVVGTFILVEVTGSSAGAPSQRAYSTTVGFVTEAPSVVSPPTFAPTNAEDGDRRFVGQALSASVGSFTEGNPESTLDQISFVWLRCPAAVTTTVSVRPTGCAPLATPDPLSYTTVAADAGNFITVEEVRRNEAGTATSIAVSGSRAVSAVPTNSVSPSVSGSAWVGKVLTTANGTWAGPPAPTVTREWMSCTTSLATAGPTPPANCATLLDGNGQPQTGATYTLDAADESKFILVKVTGSNDAGSLTRYSATAGPIKVKPTVVTFAAINDLDQPGADSTTNSGIVGFAHSATAGTWSGSSPLANPAAYQWYLCTSAVPAATTTAPTSSGCTAIASATRISYTPVAANAGKYLTFTETQTNGTEPVTAWAASTPGPIVTAISAPSVAPIVSVVGGVNATTPQLGVSSSVSTSNGTWAATPAVSYRYQWFACATVQSATASAVPGGCNPVSGATSQSMPLGVDRTDLIGKFLLAKVTAYHPLTPKNTRSIYSASTKVGVQSKPQVKTASSITGVPYVAATLTANPGDAFALPVATPKYQWLTCTSSIDAPVAGLVSARPSACSPITGAISPTYAVAEADFGKFITVQVTWTNTLDTVGTVSFAKSTSAIVRGPVNRVAPVIQARAAGPVVGEDIRVQSIPADWTGSPTLSYQWYSCSASVSSATDALPGVCSIIDGAQSDTFRVRSTDERLYVIAGVTATNGDGQSTKFSASSTQVLSIPASVTDPVVTGKSFVGTRLTATSGTWTGFTSPAYTYDWFVCSSATTGDSAGDATCATSAVATGQTYTPVVSQVGSYLRVRVTATNPAGATQIWSATTEAIAEGPFIVTSATIRGTADVASATPLTATPGAWGGNPYPVIAGQWMRCDSNRPSAVAGAAPAGCSVIEGQTELTYALRAEDAGKFVSYFETATNNFGSDSQTSISTAQVTMPPTVSVEPRISGAPEVGGTLTRVAGEWIGFPTPTNPAAGANSWWRCSTAVGAPTASLPASCTQITTATGTSYTLVQADKNFYIVYREQKKNGPTGTITVNRFTASTALVTSPPVRSSDVVVTSIDRMTNATPKRVAPVVGKSITVTPGTWTGGTATDITLTHRWYRCTTQVTLASDTRPDGCVLSDATDAVLKSYSVSAADVGYFLVSEETATNVAATRVRFSASTLVVQELPSTVVSPSVSGSRLIGSTLTVDRGQWAGTSDIATTVEWYRCSAVVTNPSTLPGTCFAIAGQISDTYVIANADAANYVTARVVAKNPATNISAPASINYLVPVGAAEITAKAPNKTAASFVAPTIALKEVDMNERPDVGDSYEALTGTWPGAAPTPTYTYEWYACTEAQTSAADTAGPDCTLIVGDTDSQLLLTADMVSAETYIRAKVTATNSAGTDFKFTASSTQTVTKGLTYTTEPSISPVTSQVFDGVTPRVITVNGGHWDPPGVVGSDGSSGDVQTYGWIRCPRKVPASVLSSPIGCYIIQASSTVSTYTIQPADAGFFIAAVVTQKAFKDSAHATFERRRVVTVSTDMVLEAPSITAAQTLSGTNTVGERITSTPGTWRGAETPAKTFAWYRCDTAVTVTSTLIPSGCAVIANQTSSTYLLTADDREKYIASFVTATNATGDATSFSLSTGQIRVKPVNLTAPTSTDRPIIGQPFTANLGTWDGFPAPTFRIDWYTCSSVVSNPANSVQSGVCSTFTGGTVNEGASATTTTITVPSGNAQRYMLLQVTATNSAGNAVKTSATSQQIWEIPNISATGAKPAISGTANVGQRVTINNGTWAGFPNPSPSYTWYVCDNVVTSASTTLPASGCTLTSTTTAFFDITLAEGGKALMAGVTQVNSAGTGVYYSPSTVLIGYEPRATVSPTVTPSGGSDNNFVGRVLNGTLGTWAGYTSPGNPTAIGVNTYQWYACSAAITTPMTTLPTGGTCVAISGATSANFTMTDAQAGKHVALYVTQQNKVNAANVSSYVASPVQDVKTGTRLSTSVFVRQAPVRAETAAETFTSGTANVGSTLALSASTWRGFPAPAANQTGVEWFLCPRGAAAIAECNLLPSQTSQSIAVISDYAGKFLWGRSWAQNSVARTTSVGAKSQVISEAPVALGSPQVTPVTPDSLPSPRVNQLLTTTVGTWRSTAGANASPLDLRTHTYTWYSCPASSSLLSACALRGSANSAASTFTPTATDNGRFITVVVKARNSVNSSATGTATTPSADVANQSALLGPVNFAPTNAGELSLASSSATSAVRVDDTVTITGEAWSAEPSISQKTYEWFTCTAAVTTRPTTVPSNCTKITTAGADASSLIVNSGFGGKHLLAKVTATNTVGSTVRWSLSMGAVTMAPLASTNPGVTGIAELGRTLTVSTSSGWTGFPTPAVTYRWFVCSDSESAAPDVLPSNCSQILNQTGSTMTLTSTMNIVDRYILVEEKGANSTGARVKFSATVGPVRS
jgi:hypothetical protein